MAINPPVTHTVISSAQWGIPLTNEVNRLTAAQQAGVPTAWVAVTYQNGWVDIDSGRAVRYRKIGDLVYLQGCMKNGSLGYGVAAFTLPAGYRPRADTVFATSMNAGVASVFILATGVVSCSTAIAGGTNAFVYVDLPPFQAVN